MSEINMDEETEKKLDEIFNSIKIECKVPSSECEQSMEAIQRIQRTNDLVGQVRHCQSLSTLFQHAKNLDYAYKPFKTIQINDITIDLDSDIVIYTKEDGYCVGKTTEIIGVVRFQQYTPIIRIQWYYSKKDLRNIIGKYEDCVSEKELFLSDKFDLIQPDTVIALAIVLDFREFDKLKVVDDFTYFSRSLFKNQQIIPPIQKWEKHCKCRLPMNPDKFYIQCDTCQEWYHPQCLGVKPTLIEKKFVCFRCKKPK